MSEYLKAVNERVVIFDGAMGTNIQFRNPTPDDYWGKEGCNELLVLSRPDIIRDIHADFFTRRLRRGGDQHLRRHPHRAGRVRACRTKSVNSTSRPPGWRARSPRFQFNGKPRFVAGSMGPTTKLPSLGHIGFDDMARRLHRAG